MQHAAVDLPGEVVRRSGCRGRRRPRRLPCSAWIAGSRSAMSANASSHVASACDAVGLLDQRRAQPLGVLVMGLSATPFGQRKPWEKTSSSSPRTCSTRSPSRVISRPHVASQKGHVRYAVLHARLTLPVAASHPASTSEIKSGPLEREQVPGALHHLQLGVGERRGDVLADARRSRRRPGRRRGRAWARVTALEVERLLLLLGPLAAELDRPALGVGDVLAVGRVEVPGPEARR